MRVAATSLTYQCVTINPRVPAKKKARAKLDQTPFQTVKEQLSADMAMLREVSAST